MNTSDLQTELCRQLCTNIKLVERENGPLMISNPFTYPDGDHYSIYLKERNNGQFRISDEANTMMRLSYDTPDVDKYFKGGKGKIMEQILREKQVKEANGNFYVDTSIEKISECIFRLSQALSQVYDLSYLNRDRPASTFYHELEELLNAIASEYSVELEKKYVVPDLENAENYVIDYSLQKKEHSSLFLFGIPSADKAKLVTITLQHLLLYKFRIPTLLIFENQEELSPKHLSRLMDANIGGSQVSSIESKEPIEQNIKRYVTQERSMQ